ncbi:hypothetical protein ACCO45_005685 [Purpureocillium lilacinum]|uniref:Uncharacterized protein n=1 Tax=Purpureocillium lilacinum TaxID=33203 RepID=A0ACC4DWV7_PURLI
MKDHGTGRCNPETLAGRHLPCRDSHFHARTVNRPPRPLLSCPHPATEEGPAIHVAARDPFSCIAQHQHNNARDHLGPATKAGRQAPCSMPAHAISRFVRASFPPCAICWQQLHRNRRGLTKRPPTAELRRGPAPRGQPVKQAQDALSPDDARPTQRGLSDETRPADRLCVAAYQDQARPCHQRFEAVAARRRDAPGPGLPGLMASSSKAPGCTTLQEPRKAVSLGRPRSPSVLAPRLIGGVASLDVSPGTVARPAFDGPRCRFLDLATSTTNPSAV